MKEAEELTTRDCNFILLAELPNGDIHQVLIHQEALQYIIREQKEFKAVETPITTVESIKVKKHLETL